MNSKTDEIKEREGKKEKDDEKVQMNFFYIDDTIEEKYDEKTLIKPQLLCPVKLTRQRALFNDDALYRAYISKSLNSNIFLSGGWNTYINSH